MDSVQQVAGALRKLATGLALFALAACGTREVPSSGDASSNDAGSSSDAGVRDGGVEADAGPVIDGGPVVTVGGVPGGRAGVGATIAGCQIFPNDNAWNVEVDGPAVRVIHTYDAHLPQTTRLHPDFGDYTNDHYGIPFNVVGAGQADVETTFTLYANENDPGPGGWVGANPVTTQSHRGVTAYPFFVGMHIEGAPAPGGMPGSLPGDQHGLVLKQGASGCQSYEAWNCAGTTSPSFFCANGAVFDLTSNARRPAGWTSGDLAGMSILAGLVRFSEVQAGTVTHAIRVTFNSTQSGYIPPASHAVNPGSGSAAGSLGSSYPPMGLRLRLKAGVSISQYAPASRAILAAMKKYGLIVADIGSDWYFQGDSDDGWATPVAGGDTLIDQINGDFRQITGADFEAIDTGSPVATGL